MIVIDQFFDRLVFRGILIVRKDIICVHVLVVPGLSWNVAVGCEVEKEVVAFCAEAYFIAIDVDIFCR